MFLPLENTYAPFNLVLISMTVRATNSFSSNCRRESTDFSGDTKYRQISGTSVISGMIRIGITSACTISKPSFNNVSHSRRVVLSSKKIWNA